MTAFPRTKRRNRHKLETQKCTFAPASGQSLKKAKKVDPANTEEIPSETGILSGKTRPCLSLKKRRSHSKKNKRGREKKRTVTFSLPADQERSKAEIESKAVMPLQKKDVLKFSVLPKTFNFKDTSNGRKEHNDPVPEISDLVEEQRKSQSQTIKTAMGPWYPNPENTFMSMPLTPTTDGLFHEFQRKYKDKMQPSVDK
ncbi:hypothetical protein PBY51_012175 [Eleginops maclovinus]|nr:hypothetical protein PBY51_012175 [Eleginops maclovinus]